MQPKKAICEYYKAEGLPYNHPGAFCWIDPKSPEYKPDIAKERRERAAARKAKSNKTNLVANELPQQHTVLHFGQH